MKHQVTKMPTWMGRDQYTAKQGHLLYDRCLLLELWIPGDEYEPSGAYLAQKQSSALEMHCTRQDEVP